MSILVQFVNLPYCSFFRSQFTFVDLYSEFPSRSSLQSIPRPRPAEMNHRGSEKNGTTPIFGRIPEIRGEEKEMDDQESIFGGRPPLHAPSLTKKYIILGTPLDVSRPTFPSIDRHFWKAVFFSCSQAYMVACRALSMAFKEAFCIVWDFEGGGRRGAICQKALRD